jgi:nucleoside 2-deoxyribosyltransferase
MKKVYLAIPYSRIEDLSHAVANDVSALLIGQGCIVFSPISHSHPIWKTGMAKHPHSVWMEQDKAFVDWAEEIYVVNIVHADGERLIRESKGVQMELAWAREQGKPITTIHYDHINRKIVDNE